MENLKARPFLLILVLFSQVALTIAEESHPQYQALFSPSKFALENFSRPYKESAQLLSQNNTDAALRTLNEIPESKKEKDRTQAALILGAVLQAKGDDKQAAQVLQEFLKERPACADAMFLLALSRARLGASAEAITLLEEALWFSKTSFIPLTTVRLEMARLYRINNNGAKAKELLEKISGEENASVGAVLELATMQSESGEKDKAISSLRKVLSMEPANSQAGILLSKNLLLGLNRFNTESSCKESKDLTAKLIESGSLNPVQKKEALIIRTQALICAKEIESAKSVLAKMEKAYPGDPQVLHLKEQLTIEATENLS